MFGKMTSVTAAGAFMLAIFGAGAYYVFQNRSTNAAEAFVVALQRNDAEAMRRLFNAPLRERTDAAVLQAWIDAVHEGLGTLEIADPSQVVSQSTTVEGQTRQVFEAPLRGAKGNPLLELELAGGGINRFEILSDAIDPQWFEQIEDTSVYEKEAIAFLTALLNNEPDKAYKLLHIDAKEVLSKEEMRRMAAELHQAAGPLEGTPKLVGSRFQQVSYLVATSGEDPEERRLRLVYDITCKSGANTRAALDFKLEGFRFFLIAFDLTGATSL